MGIGRYMVKEGESFHWDAFQKHMDYSDPEIRALKADLLKSNYVQKGAEATFNDKWVVVEVVESHGCESGMRVGDRLYFKNTGSLLDPSRSSPWCPHAMSNLSWYVRGFRALHTNDKNPEDMYVLYGGCQDSGSHFGLGRIVFKMFFVQNADIDKI